MEISKIVITGGPCAGKTTALVRVIEHFSSLGFKVFTIPEVPTLFTQAGMNYLTKNKGFFYEGEKASIYTITRDELKRFNFIRGDAEGIVNIPLQVKGMRLSISLREDTERDVVRVSLRSVDDFPCNRMAEEFFNGGGHLNASGGELPFPMEEAVKTAEKAIEAYRDLL